jgi:hypothetical protein
VPEGQLLTKTRLIRAAGLRWPVEEDFEFAKDYFGPDQCQARLYTAITRHVVLVMAALAVCAVTAALLRDRTDTQAPPPASPDQPAPAEPGMIPLTVPEIKRLLAAVLLRPNPPAHAGHWLNWRRRHQARSRWHHKRARLARDAENALVSQQLAAAVLAGLRNFYFCERQKVYRELQVNWRHNVFEVKRPLQLACRRLEYR